jgi:S-adenosylmethionine decarboxylase
MQLAVEQSKDHFVERNGKRYAGDHLIIDLYRCNPVRLKDEGHIERVLRQAADVAGATVLSVHTHVFEEGGGISGVAVLSESHISIHTWPERGYAALDVFMCGDTEPNRCIPVLLDAFSAKDYGTFHLRRGEKVF